VLGEPPFKEGHRRPPVSCHRGLRDHADRGHFEVRLRETEIATELTKLLSRNFRKLPIRVFSVNGACRRSADAGHDIDAF
jgi:hypothetical protein